MVYWWIEFSDVEFQTINGIINVWKWFPDIFYYSMNASSFNATICVFCEDRYEYGFQYVHYGMMYNPVWIVWKLVYFPFFRVEYFERFVLRCFEVPILQKFMKFSEIFIPIPSVPYYSVHHWFSFACFCVGEVKIFNVANFLVQVSYSFHLLVS